MKLIAAYLVSNTGGINLIKYIILAILCVIWLLINYWYGRRIFEKNIYKIYRTLHVKLIFARRGDKGSYIKATKYLSEQDLRKDALDRLLLLVQSKIPNVAINSQMFGSIFSMFLSMVVLLFGAIFSGIIGTLLSKYIEVVLNDGDKIILSTIKESVDHILDSSQYDFISLVLMFLIITSGWGMIQIRENETKLIIERILKEELKRRESSVA